MHRTIGAGPLAHDAVQLVKEYRAGLVVPSQLEQNANQFFGLTTPFGHNRARRDIKERGLALRRHSLCQHRLSCARRPKQ
jgi:2-methylcitrate dehydratase PrpD